jgi:hypothetical protein
MEHELTPRTYKEFIQILEKEGILKHSDVVPYDIEYRNSGICRFYPEESTEQSLYDGFIEELGRRILLDENGRMNNQIITYDATNNKKLPRLAGLYRRADTFSLNWNFDPKDYLLIDIFDFIKEEQLTCYSRLYIPKSTKIEVYWVKDWYAEKEKNEKSKVAYYTIDHEETIYAKI